MKPLLNLRASAQITTLFTSRVVLKAGDATGAWPTYPQSKAARFLAVHPLDQRHSTTISPCPAYAGTGPPPPENPRSVSLQRGSVGCTRQSWQEPEVSHAKSILSHSCFSPLNCQVRRLKDWGYKVTSPLPQRGGCCQVRLAGTHLMSGQCIGCVVASFL